MNKNLVLIVIGVIVVAVLGSFAGLLGVGAVSEAQAVPPMTGAVTLVLGALLAILDPTPIISGPPAAGEAPRPVGPVAPGVNYGSPSSAPVSSTQVVHQAPSGPVA
jgi:hypothetical protein